MFPMRAGVPRKQSLLHHRGEAALLHDEGANTTMAQRGQSYRAEVCCPTGRISSKVRMSGCETKRSRSAAAECPG